MNATEQLLEFLSEDATSLAHKAIRREAAVQLVAEFVVNRTSKDELCVLILNGSAGVRHWLLSDVASLLAGCYRTPYEAKRAITRRVRVLKGGK